MKYKIICILMMIFTVNLLAQDKTDNPINKFSFLIDNDWEIIGKWENGGTFKQVYTSEWGLNKSIIKIKMTGIINLETGERGLRNEAVFKFDKNENKFKMYTFDIFGGTIISTIHTEGNKIYFVYPYDFRGHKTELRNVWIKSDDDNFDFIIEAKEGGGWNTVLLKGKITRIKK